MPAYMHHRCRTCRGLHAILSGWVLALTVPVAAADGPPAFLVVQWEATAKRAQHPLVDLPAIVQASGGEVLAAADAHVVEVLEPGSPGRATVLLRWPERSALDAAWSEIASILPAEDEWLVLAIEGLPAEGLPPDATLPNVANVPPIDGNAPVAYMLVQGSVTDAGAMPAYRALIQPMLVERGAYYIVYAGAADVDVLRGVWGEHALIVSRWPDRERANEFWFSRVYQDEAIPARMNASRFTVLLLQQGCKGEKKVHLCEP